MRRPRSRRRRSRPRGPRASYREHHATATRASRYAFAPVPARLASLSFFFPALNEEAHVRAIVDEALAVLPRFAEDLEVTVVDDGSTDRTGAIADEAAARDPRVRVIHHGRRRGYGGAIRSGLLAAKDDWIFYTDGDRQFALEDLGRLIEASGDADAVVGYRIKRADPVRRRFVVWVYNRLIRLLFGGGWRDVDCAFKFFRRDVFARVPLARVRSDGAYISRCLSCTNTLPWKTPPAGSSATRSLTTTRVTSAPTLPSMSTIRACASGRSLVMPAIRVAML